MPAADSTPTAVLAAAVRLIAQVGLRAVSHRAVEREAGVSHGTTTYWFGTREKIVDAVLEHLAQRDLEAAARAGAAFAGPFDVDQLADAMAALLMSDGHEAVARYELMLEVARRPELRPGLQRWRETFAGGFEAVLTELGAPNPHRAARWWLAAVDGLLLDELCAGTAGFRQHARPVVRAMLGAALAIPPDPEPGR